MNNQPAGWYLQPDGSQRYWDGLQWTQHVVPQSPTATPQASTQAPQPLLADAAGGDLPSRPWFKRKRVIIPAAAVLLMIALAATQPGPAGQGAMPAEGTTPTASSSSQPMATEAATQAPAEDSPEPSAAAEPEPSEEPEPVEPSGPLIEEGNWIVGEDFPAGTYTVIEPVQSTCYWGIYKADTNQEDIIANAIVTGGFPTVTLKKGQEFDSGCGVWGTEPAAAKLDTIEVGVWTVNRDIKAGKYRLTEAATDTCYWGIYKAGSNQRDIIANDIVTGGRPTVTLKKGQEFESGCGTWALR